MLVAGQVAQVESQIALEDLRRAAERAGYYPVMTLVLAWVQRKKVKGSGGLTPKAVTDNAHKRQHAFSSTISRHYDPQHPLGKSKPLMRFCNLNASTHGYLCWWHQITDPKRHTKYHHEPEYWDGYMKALEGHRQRLELTLHDPQALQVDEVMPMHRYYWRACLDVSQHVLRGYKVSEVGSVMVR
ncbi:MAG: hypothetical protein CMQ61_14610 [Gammaproteobacteria bacterium]|nr:hypothetical protein [Gammaproteobacteria bacterium]